VDGYHVPERFDLHRAYTWSDLLTRFRSARHGQSRTHPGDRDTRTASAPAANERGAFTAMTGSAPTYYTASFWLAGSNERVTVDHLTRFDLHEA
jgi:hypothetical protein